MSCRTFLLRYTQEIINYLLRPEPIQLLTYEHTNLFILSLFRCVHILMLDSDNTLKQFLRHLTRSAQFPKL